MLGVPSMLCSLHGVGSNHPEMYMELLFTSYFPCQEPLYHSVSGSRSVFHLYSHLWELGVLSVFWGLYFQTKLNRMTQYLSILSQPAVREYEATVTGYYSFQRSFSNGLCGKIPSFYWGHRSLGVLPVKNETNVCPEHVPQHWTLPVFFWSSSLFAPKGRGHKCHRRRKEKT